MLTIVMYHYVREPTRTRFPGIHARTPSELVGQLDYVERHYTVVGCDDVRQSVASGKPLPPLSCLLSFDDGLVEHLDTVVPELRRRELTACFAVPAAPVLDRRVLDVQKSQHVLAASTDHAALADELLQRAEALAEGESTTSSDELRLRYAQPGRYDGAETMLSKRLLQDVLPERVRRLLLDQLFADLVSDDEAAFADRLYLSLDDTRELAAAGMEVAAHGDDHRRLALLDEAGQRHEIDRSVELLRQVHDGSRPNNWTMTYPYGSRNQTTLRLLSTAGCTLGLTTDVGLASRAEHPLELPRLNTNDLPTTADGPPSDWTLAASQDRAPRRRVP